MTSIMMLYTLTQVLLGDVDVILLICTVVFGVLTLVSLVLSHLKNFHAPMLLVIIKSSYILATVLLMQSDSIFVFGVAIVSYLFFSFQLFITFGLDSTQKIGTYSLVIIPILICAVLLNRLKDGTGNIFFIAGFIIVLIGIHQAIEQFNESLNREIELKDELFEKTHSENLNLEQSQAKIKAVYEQMSKQKYELEQTNKRLSKVSAEIYIQNELLKYISAALEIDQLLDLVTDSVLGAIGTDTCSLLIYEEDGEKFYAEAKSTSDTEATQHFIKLIESGQMDGYMQSKKPIIDGDVSEGEYVFSGTQMVGSLISVPLVRNGSVYGLMFAEHHQKNYFGESTLEFFEAIATQINIAVNNASLYSKMEEMARIDSLTNLYNRRAFQNLLEGLFDQYKLENKSFSVILFDIDFFKKVNDTYGHLFGDQAIKMVSKIANEYADKVNGFAGRYGGEEFVLVVPDRTVEQTYGFMALMHEDIKAQVLHHEKGDVMIDVSIGITTFPEFGIDAEDLLNRADNAMYYAKSHGRGRIQVDEVGLDPQK